MRLASPLTPPPASLAAPPAPRHHHQHIPASDAERTEAEQTRCGGAGSQVGGRRT